MLFKCTLWLPAFGGPFQSDVYVNASNLAECHEKLSQFIAKYADDLAAKLRSNASADPDLFSGLLRFADDLKKAGSYMLGTIALVEGSVIP